MKNDFFQRDTDVAKIADDGTSTPSGTKPPDFIAENARGPRRVQGDSGSVEQHSLQDQIAAERFLQSKKAAQKQGLGIKLTKLSPDGTI